ncbi:MAG TPA: alkaline phosphatase family protein, partial [Actinomycetota bacterium]|nr:alkaline phosphatase family protein [Actinomycetota bacterium]
MLTSLRVILIALVALAAGGLALAATDELTHRDELEPFTEQICGVDPEWLELVKRGLFDGRNGDIIFLPDTPIYFSGGGDGWSHSGPWRYLQHVPLVFYGPGRIPAGIRIAEPTTTADIAPTIAALMKGVVPADGKVLTEVAPLSGRSLRRPSPRLILTIVLDGAGWNVLDRWSESWPTLRRMMDEGVSYTNATVGSSPSVTPAVHTTLGTGRFPDTHGVTSIPVRDEAGDVVDPFYEGQSSRLIEVPTVAELWDEQNDNDALVGMIGHVPWHLGMIGKGAEDPGGDADHAAWLDYETNDWITNLEHYSLPAGFDDQSDLAARLDALDASDGAADGFWRDVPLDDPSRVEEVPAFTQHHVNKLIEFMARARYGGDEITDLLFTNFKQIDLLGHIFNMTSIQVRDAIVAGDAALTELIDYLDASMARGDYVVIVTADHGQQPDEHDLGSYGIDSNEMTADIEREFGPVVADMSPTEIFLELDHLGEGGYTAADVATFVGDYTIRDNATDFGVQTFGSGRFAPGDRVMEMAVPTPLLGE